MTRRMSLWRLLDRLTSFLPSGPDDQPRPSTTPDPNEPGISADTRRARLRLWRHRYEKGGKGGQSLGGSPEPSHDRWRFIPETIEFLPAEE